LLGNVEDLTSGVPLEVAVERIDPTRSNPYVQANAAGFHAGVVQITVKEYTRPALLPVTMHSGKLTLTQSAELVMTLILKTMTGLNMRIQMTTFIQDGAWE